MADFDAETLAEQAVLIGLLSRDQVRQVRDDAENGSIEAVTRTLLRKGFLTSWQVDRLLKGDVQGFFYGGCKVLFHIAEGTFARVYRGERVPGGQSVAIKVLRRRFTTDPAAVARFNQEAEAGMKLIHPNIVRILDYGEQDRNHYMIMEYVEGSNLRDFLKIRHRLSATEAMPLMLGLARGLKHSLDQGVTHRDIKGTNILIGSRGEAKLVDFGLATVGGDERKMEAAHGVRTVDYSTLERTCLSPKGDPRSDIFFLGCVFYQMLTGQLPMPDSENKDILAKMLKRNINAIKPLSEQRHAPPEALSRIIEKMMRVDLKQRYQTMDQVLADLEAYQADLAAARAAEEAIMARYDPIVDDRSDEFYDDGFEVKALAQKTVLCVEIQDAIQDAFRKTIAAMGYRVLLVKDAERAVERFLESKPEAVVFDADGLGPNAVEAYLDMVEKASDAGHDFSSVLLFGPRQAAQAGRLAPDPRTVVLVKPIKMKDIQDAIGQMVPLP